MDFLKVECEWTDEDAEAVVDQLPEDTAQACHMLMVLLCAVALEIGMSKSNLTDEIGKCFDVAESEVGLQ